MNPEDIQNIKKSSLEKNTMNTKKEMRIINISLKNEKKESADIIEQIKTDQKSTYYSNSSNSGEEYTNKKSIQKSQNINKKMIGKKRNKVSISKKEKISENQNNIINRIMKIYPESAYKNDLKKQLENPLHQFMYKNFASMYSINNFYNYISLLNKKRTENRQIFIDNSNVNNLKNYCVADDVKDVIPKKVWSPKIDIDINKFYEQCMKIWPSNKCMFVKENALEYLMNNDYKIDKCIKNLDAFVNFMIDKNSKNNYIIVDDNVKVVKGYNMTLRNKHNL